MKCERKKWIYSNNDERWICATMYLLHSGWSAFLNHFKNNTKSLLAVVYWVAGKSSDAQTIWFEMMATVSISNPQKFLPSYWISPSHIPSCLFFHHRCHYFDPWNLLIWNQPISLFLLVTIRKSIQFANIRPRSACNNFVLNKKKKKLNHMWNIKLHLFPPSISWLLCTQQQSMN